MAGIVSWKDLRAWQKSHELVLETYRLTRKFPPEEKFGLSSQMRRAAISVASNIVEGFHRRSVKDSLNFYNTADSSLEELKYQLLLSRDLEYVSVNDFEQAATKAIDAGKTLGAWIVSQRANAKT